jgi:F-actin capping protein alpha subunit
VSEYNKLENGSFVDYESSKSFQFDHLNNKPYDWEDYALESDVSSQMYCTKTTSELTVVCLSVNLSALTCLNITLLSPLMQSTLPHHPT